MASFYNYSGLQGGFFDQSFLELGRDEMAYFVDLNHGHLFIVF